MKYALLHAMKTFIPLALFTFAALIAFFGLIPRDTPDKGHPNSSISNKIDDTVASTFIFQFTYTISQLGKLDHNDLVLGKDQIDRSLRINLDGFSSSAYGKKMEREAEKILNAWNDLTADDVFDQATLNKYGLRSAAPHDIAIYIYREIDRYAELSSTPVWVYDTAGVLQTYFAIIHIQNPLIVEQRPIEKLGVGKMQSIGIPTITAKLSHIEGRTAKVKFRLQGSHSRFKDIIEANESLIKRATVKILQGITRSDIISGHAFYDTSILNQINHELEPMLDLDPSVDFVENLYFSEFSIR